MATSQHARRATIHDVALEAGISRGTVSRVINGERYVSESARAAVEQAILKVGYVPNAAARNLVRQRSQAVGFVVHEAHTQFLEDPNIGAMLLGANAALSNADYQMVSLVIDSDRDRKRVERYLGGGFVDGVVIISARSKDPVTRMISKLQIPAAFVGRPDSIGDIPYAGINNRDAAMNITKRLRDTGRRSIGMIAAALDRDSGADRLDGFRAALGDEFRADLVAEVPLYTYAAGFDAMTDLLAREPRIDGVFAASDAIAAGAMDALRRAGRRIPEDIGVVGFDDSAWARRTTPALSTVHQPAGELGYMAAELVIDQLRGERTDTAGVLLRTPIVWRDSA